MESKIAKFSIKGGQIKAILVGNTIADWQYIKAGGFTCWDDYVFLPDNATSLLLLTVRLNELGYQIALDDSVN